jgi:hypothetical protein
MIAERVVNKRVLHHTARKFTHVVVEHPTAVRGGGGSDFCGSSRLRRQVTAAAAAVCLFSQTLSSKKKKSSLEKYSSTSREVSDFTAPPTIRNELSRVCGTNFSPVLKPTLH